VELGLKSGQVYTYNKYPVSPTIEKLSNTKKIKPLSVFDQPGTIAAKFHGLLFDGGDFM